MFNYLICDEAHERQLCLWIPAAHVRYIQYNACNGIVVLYTARGKWGLFALDILDHNVSFELYSS